MRKTQADRQAEAARAQQITEQAIAQLPVSNSEMTKLANQISCGLFADRDTLAEAFADALSILKGNPAAVTAMYIVLNTVAKEIVKIQQKETV